MATKELKELVAFGLAAGELVAGLVDGVGFDDVAKVVKAGTLAGPGLAGAASALTEYANMTDAEAMELESFVIQNFSIPDHSVEVAIEVALGVVIKLHELVKLFLPK